MALNSLVLHRPCCKALIVLIGWEQDQIKTGVGGCGMKVVPLRALDGFVGKCSPAPLNILGSIYRQQVREQGVARMSLGGLRLTKFPCLLALAPGCKYRSKC